MGDSGARGEFGHLEVDIKDPPEESITFRGLVPFGLFQQAAERDGRRRLIGASLPEAAFFPGDRVGSGVDLDAEGTARKLLYVTLGDGGPTSTVGPQKLRSTRRSTHMLDN